MMYRALQNLAFFRGLTLSVAVAERWVHFSVGLLLLSAAALKSYHSFVVPIESDGLLSRLFTIGLIVFELQLGFWLCSGRHPRWANRVAIGVFGVFLTISARNLVVGKEACGCFGPINIKPQVSLLVDVAVVALLATVVPRHFPGRPVHAASPLRQLRVSAIPAILTCALVLVFLWVIVPPISNIVADDVILLEPERWTGERLPILPHTDIGYKLEHGTWTLVLYHHDCSRCQAAIRELEKSCEHDKLALIEMPPFGSMDRLESHSPNLTRGRLSPDKRWLAATPVVVKVHNGISLGVVD